MKLTRFETTGSSSWLALLGALSISSLTACGGSDPGPATSTPSTTTKPDKTPTTTDSTSAFPKNLLPAEVLPELPLVAPKSDLDTPVFSGIVDVGPGDDVTFCTWTNVILDKDTIFAESYGAESP